MKGVIGPPQGPRPAPSPTAPLVLVVDDDPDMRRLLGQYLQGAGYRVKTAPDAIAAGHAILSSLPDLIIADFQMPYMTGSDFIAALRADATIPDLPVIFITAAQNSPQLSGRTFGFPLLTKPIKPEDLLLAVEAELGRRRPRA